MTLIRLLSDIHTEFGPFDVPEMENDSETVLVLAGDIGVGEEHAPWIVDDLLPRFKAIVYVLGNHEFYYGSIDDVRRDWREISEGNDNLYFLDNNVAVIDGIRFIGGTLWTSFNNGDWFAEEAAKRMMNDLEVIRVNDAHRFTTYYWKAEHFTTQHFIEETLKEPFDGPTVVVTHHLPSFSSCHPRFDARMNNAYATDLEWMFHEYKIDIWMHGHTHDSYDYPVTVPFTDVEYGRIVCNPRGYHGVETNPEFDPCKIIEL